MYTWPERNNIPENEALIVVYALNMIVIVRTDGWDKIKEDIIA